jgi:hypothetical protein
MARRRLVTTRIFLWLGLCLSVPVAQASVLTFGFQCITNTNAANCLIGESQLFVDVVGFGSSTMVGSTTITPSAN